MKSDSLVSIIMPLYNCEDFVKESIDTVIAQTYQNWELIIVDDGSTDNSVNIVNDIKQKEQRVKLIRFDNNEGPARARNKGIKDSNGRYLAFLDSDDYWDRNKLKQQINFMKKRNAAFTFTSFKRIYSSEKTRLFQVPEKVTYYSILMRNIICNSSVMIDTNFIDKISYPDIRKRQDYGLWLEILKNKTKYGYGLNSVLTYRNVREVSVSSNKIELIKYNWSLYREVQRLPLLFSGSLIVKDIFIKLLRIK
ncbi:glycosyltransferase family 2 protein [Lentibacillus salicampi]|uniref:Glycosyltransferase family 2 protein n=1 Tax=Lentibacillus salicampi TaxID=175306 RepID=A0A4Y9ADM5_9BACI|nr:glycosyltransferase family 2 protein [Lentibacillus salicampi]TFJ93050.1 glycosyltransferase family 2 protein [Lentibacillus salicampi]